MSQSKLGELLDKLFVRKDVFKSIGRENILSLEQSFHGKECDVELAFIVSVWYRHPESEGVERLIKVYLDKCVSEFNHKGIADLADLMRRSENGRAKLPAPNELLEAFVLASFETFPPKKETIIKVLKNEYLLTEDTARKRADKFIEEFDLPVIIRSRGRPKYK